MTQSRLNGKSAWLEGVLFASGLSLLAIFFAFRSNQAAQLQAGLHFSHEAQQHASPEPPANLHAATTPRSLQDQTLWSEQRIGAYERSLAESPATPLAILRIDGLGIEVQVYDGESELNLNRGVARIKGTARIAQPGNLGIAGHRDGFFRALQHIHPGDLVELQTPGERVRYRVQSTANVYPTDVSVLAPADGRILTLVTCSPFYFVGHAPQRFVVTAKAEQFMSINWMRSI